ncbi:MAG: L-2-amino-thiazoline-4-carboxylic acid hydrolase [Desulfobacteraceae bacterium]|nr:L-2-amino-thiazoline-4-carboxylic acid hydrolase [Desulfobacteraceae bacterium]MBC2755730.1 L-2-amino-thiazoline-4-carboxylic acid hydrolase [Desulfobacteraceae bacterium]
MIKLIFFTLSSEVGGFWPLLLVKSLLKRNDIVKQTRWASDAVSGQEAGYAKRFAMASALYLKLGEKVGKQKAFDVMRRILVPIGCNAVQKHFNSLNLSNLSGMPRLMAFNDLMVKNDEAKFNVREYVTVNDSICHYIIKRCVVYDFLLEAGTPELTRLICDVDKEFFPQAFPDFTFDRGNSWENTIAYGKAHCDFILKKKASPE